MENSSLAAADSNNDNDNNANVTAAAARTARHRGVMLYPGVIVEDLGEDVAKFGCNHRDQVRLEAPLAEYQARVQAVRSAMAKEGVDLLCVKNEDLRYLTGFHTIGDTEPQTLLLPLNERPVMVARLLETELIKKYTWVSQWWSCLDAADAAAVFSKALSVLLGDKLGSARVAVELDQISAKMWAALRSKNPDVNFVDSDRLVEKIRLVKTAHEVQNIRKAAELTTLAINVGMSSVKAGALLSEIYLSSFQALIGAGSEEPAYLPIVRSTDPAGHGTWEIGERVQAGEKVFLELAGSVYGHHSPRMQTAYILPDRFLLRHQHRVSSSAVLTAATAAYGHGDGDDDDDDDGAMMGAPAVSTVTGAPLPAYLAEAEALLCRVFSECLPMMRPGVRASEIDARGRRIMESNSFGATVVARLGYTVGGTATHPTGYAGWGDAAFSIAGNNHQPLRAGQVFHFIPWLQVNEGRHRGPIGLSDTVLVTASGGERLGGHPLYISVFTSGGEQITREEATPTFSAAAPDLPLPLPPRTAVSNGVCVGGGKVAAAALRTAAEAAQDDMSAALASDNSSGIHPRILRAIKVANSASNALGYGGDRFTAAAAEMLKRHFGPTCAPYLLSIGTAANVLAISSLLRSHQTILCADTSHLAADECGAPEKFTGCKLIPVKTERGGKLTPESVAAAAGQLLPIPHRTQPGVLSVAQPTELGAIYTPAELRALADFAHTHGFLLHLDGARLSNAVARLRPSPQSSASSAFRELTFDLGVDVVSLGGSKHGLECAEAVIFKDADSLSSRNFIYTRKQGMQLVSKMRFLAAQFSEWLGEDELWRTIADAAHESALYLAEQLQCVSGVHVTLPVETNMVFFCFDGDGDAHDRAVKKLQEEFRFLAYPSKSVGCRLVTSFSTTQAQIDRFLQSVRKCLPVATSTESAPQLGGWGEHPEA